MWIPHSLQINHLPNGCLLNQPADVLVSQGAHSLLMASDPRSNLAPREVLREFLANPPPLLGSRNHLPPRGEPGIQAPPPLSCTITDHPHHNTTITATS